MIAHIGIMLASFTRPWDIGATPGALLFALPLIAVVAVVYKATKIEKITLASFIKTSAILFGSIVVFMVLTAIGLFVLVRFTVG